jgi:hypothetical protein
MSIIYIERPAVPANGFTTLPNALFDCSTFNLKPRDQSVLNYLLTKRADWKIRVSDIAKHCCISKNTVYTALKVLQERGIARWERLKTGHTHWFIRIPDLPITPAITPHPKKPHHEKPDTNFSAVLTSNKNETSIKKTTTAPSENLPICEPIVVVSEKIVLPTVQHSEPIKPVVVETVSTQQVTESFQPVPDMTVLECFDDQEKRLVTHELNKVTSITNQAVILFMLKNAIVNNTVKRTPIAMIRGLINLAIDGLLDTKYELAKMKQAEETNRPKPVIPQLSAEERKAKEQAMRVAQLKELVAKHPESIAEVKRIGAFHFGNRGVFFKSEFKLAGFDVT